MPVGKLSAAALFLSSVLFACASAPVVKPYATDVSYIGVGVVPVEQPLAGDIAAIPAAVKNAVEQLDVKVFASCGGKPVSVEVVVFEYGERIKPLENHLRALVERRAAYSRCKVTHTEPADGSRIVATLEAHGVEVRQHEDGKIVTGEAGTQVRMENASLDINAVANVRVDVFAADGTVASVMGSGRSEPSRIDSAGTTKPFWPGDRLVPPGVHGRRK